MERLLTREEFKVLVFKRDKHTCVVPKCGRPAVDAHHILDRKLFKDGGYYLANGASLCGACHWDAETGVITVEQVREYSKIEIVILPPGFNPRFTYDKWGNSYHAVDHGTKAMKGPLFHDAGVQKILKQTGRIRYFF